MHTVVIKKYLYVYLYNIKKTESIDVHMGSESIIVSITNIVNNKFLPINRNTYCVTQSFKRRMSLHAKNGK